MKSSTEYIFGGALLLIGIGQVSAGVRASKTGKAIGRSLVLYEGKEAEIHGKWIFRAGILFIALGILAIALGIYAEFN